MRLDGLGLFVDDMAKMIRFYKDVLGFEIKEEENTSNVYLVKDGTLFLLYGRNDFEKMTNRRYEYIKGLNGHSEIALYVDTFEEVDEAYKKADVYTKELFIDRRENSKSLAWSSVLLAFHNIPQIGCVVDRPKALGDIRGVTYIYAIFYRFGLIDAPEKAKEKMEPVRNKDSEQISFV